MQHPPPPPHSHPTLELQIILRTKIPPPLSFWMPLGPATVNIQIQALCLQIILEQQGTINTWINN